VRFECNRAEGKRAGDSQSSDSKNVSLRQLRVCAFKQIVGMCVLIHSSAACQWDGDIIVVNGSVQIVDPYGMENVRGDEKGVKEVKALVGLRSKGHSVVRENEITCFLVYTCLFTNKKSELQESNQRPLDCCGAATTV